MLAAAAKPSTLQPKKVPVQSKNNVYLDAAAVLKLCKTGASLENFSVKNEVSQLAKKTMDHEPEIDKIVEKINIHTESPGLDKVLVKIIIADLIWLNKFIIINKDIKETKIVKRYQEQIKDHQRKPLTLNVSAAPAIKIVQKQVDEVKELPKKLLTSNISLTSASKTVQKQPDQVKELLKKPLTSNVSQTPARTVSMKNNLYSEVAAALNVCKTGKIPLTNFKLKLGISQLAKKTLDHEHEVDEIMKTIQILNHNPGLDKLLAKIIITDLIWHNKYITLMDDVKETKIVQKYQEQILKLSKKPPASNVLPAPATAKPASQKDVPVESKLNLYPETAAALKVCKTGVPLENFALKHEVYQLTKKTIENELEIDDILEKIQIMYHYPSLDKILAKVIVADLIWHNKYIKFNEDIKETKLVQKYQEPILVLHRASLKSKVLPPLSTKSTLQKKVTDQSKNKDYSEAAAALKVCKTGISIENFSLRHEVYQLAKKTLDNESKIDDIMEKIQIVYHYPSLDKMLAKTIIADLLWHNKYIKIDEDIKETKLIQKYQQSIQDLHRNSLTSNSLPASANSTWHKYIQNYQGFEKTQTFPKYQEPIQDVYRTSLTSNVLPSSASSSWQQYIRPNAGIDRTKIGQTYQEPILGLHRPSLSSSMLPAPANSTWHDKYIGNEGTKTVHKYQDQTKELYRKPFSSNLSLASTAQSVLQKQVPVQSKNNVYLEAAAALKVCRTGVPLENFSVKHEVFQLAKKTMDHELEIEYTMEKTQLLHDHPSLDEVLAKVIIADLIWHDKCVKIDKAIEETEIIQEYMELIQECYRESLTVTGNIVPLPLYIRVNTLQITVNNTIELFRQEGWNYLPPADSYTEYLKTLKNLSDNDFIKDYHVSELLVFPGDTTLSKHPGFVTGKFVLQDKASCLSSFLLNPKPGSTVLDVGAACGLKTNHLANIIRNEGLIIANDNNPKRIELLEKFIDRTESRCVKVREGDFITSTYEQWLHIQYILLDVTTTNSGIFFDQQNATRKISQAQLADNQFRLNMLLRVALQKFPKVKRVVYTACSLYPEEGEKVVDDAMRTVGGAFTLLDAKEMLWDEWFNTSSMDYLCGGRCIRTKPSTDLCLGYFIAVFERNPAVPIPQYERRFKPGEEIELDEDEAPVILYEKKNEAAPSYRNNLVAPTAPANDIRTYPMLPPYQRSFAAPNSQAASTILPSYSRSFMLPSTPTSQIATNSISSNYPTSAALPGYSRNLVLPNSQVNQISANNILPSYSRNLILPNSHSTNFALSNYQRNLIVPNSYGNNTLTNNTQLSWFKPQTSNVKSNGNKAARVQSSELKVIVPNDQTKAAKPNPQAAVTTAPKIKTQSQSEKKQRKRERMRDEMSLRVLSKVSKTTLS